MDVAIIFGSASDKEKMAGAAKCLDEFGLEYKAYIASAHRVPELLENILKAVSYTHLTLPTKRIV